jgi:hypothetical protein
MGQFFTLKTGNGTFVLMRFLMLIALCLTFQWNAYAQFEIGSLSGSIQVVEAPSHLLGQETNINLAFTYYSMPHFSRTNSMSAYTGYMIAQTDSLQGIETVYFEALGKRVAIRTKLAEKKNHVISSQEFGFERGSFHEVKGDTVIAGWPCKKAEWISMDQPLERVSVWYAPDIPCQMSDRYKGLAGMPMKFYFHQDQIRYLYEISYVSSECPDKAIFEPIPEHELLELPNQN